MSTESKSNGIEIQIQNQMARDSKPENVIETTSNNSYWEIMNDSSSFLKSLYTPCISG